MAFNSLYLKQQVGNPGEETSQTEPLVPSARFLLLSHLGSERFWSKIVKRRPDIEQVFPSDMSIDHGGFWATVTQEFLDISQVGPIFEKVSCKTVPQGVHRCWFLDT